MARVISSFRRATRRWLKSKAGVAATEAALLAPIFVLSGLAVFDLGLAGTKRLELDQGLRAGAQVSMVNVTSESDILAATLAALGESTLGEVQEDGICAPNASCVDVSYACECSDGTANACDALCPSSGDIPSAFLTIVASRRHEGLLFPDMGLQTQITVQTR
ncbi:TadE/TadG family type IV pilus assembly protein [Hyphococcus luteus]|uniref:TadE-like domain-containing protein n=1 Tax=Hyphococcus luteus TaxID=2058213 RepID=A0A2S7K3N7_9PROT|nr:TadE family protein [Marinicaulis flavus]PQA87101.1 hypothetical protein CW354_13730 [Marinicaulis flavus]